MYKNYWKVKLSYSYKSNNGVVVNTNALNNFITNNQNNNSNNNTPRAYLKYLLFDEDFKLVQGFAERIDNGAGTVHPHWRKRLACAFYNYFLSWIDEQKV